MRSGVRQSVAVLVFLVVGGSVGIVLAAGQPQHKPNPVGAAKSKVDQARKEAEAANAAVMSAQAALKKSEEHAKQVRKKVEDEFDAAPDLVAARAEFKKYDDEFNSLKGPILERLQGQADYQAALAAKEAAMKQGPKAFSDATAKVKEMAVAAINASPAAKTAYTGRTEAEAKLQELVKKRNAAMDQDSRITGLKADYEKGRAALAAAQAKLAKERRDLGEAQQRLQQEEQKARQPKPQPNKKKHK